VPRTTPTPAPAALVVPPGLRFSNPTDRERLTALVLKTPGLLAVVPTAELEPLFTAYAGAERAIGAARSLPIEGTTGLRAEVDARLRAGEDIDPTALVLQVAEAQAAQNRRDQTLSLLASLPRDYSAEIVAVVESYSDDFWAALSADLADLLDRAAVVVADLDGVTDAESAIEAGKATEWATLRGLVREYGTLRRTHADLLRAESTAAASNATLARAYFAGLNDTAPVTTATSDLHGRPVAPPLAYLLEVDSVRHLLAAVQQRDTLRPHVGRGSEAVTIPDAVVTVGTPRVSSLSAAEQASLMKRVRAANDNALADAADEMAVQTRVA
jgi:hypothetical protein